LGKHGRLAALGERLLEMTPERDLASAAADALSLAAAQLLYAGNYELASRVLVALHELVAHGHATEPGARARVHRAYSVHHAVRGEPAESLRQTHLTVDAYAEAGDTRNVCLHRTNLGQGYNELGAYDLAEKELRDSLGVAEKLGLTHVIASAKHNLGWTLSRRGAFAEARIMEQEAVDLFRSQGNRRMESASHAYLSVILTHLGEYAEAEREADTGLDIVSSTPDRLFALAARAYARVAAGSSDQGLEDAANAVKMLDALGGIDEGEMFVRCVHGDALLATGREAEARDAALCASERLMTMSAKISDPVLRESYLRAVPENARIVELAALFRVPA
jgi:tetratricopeptide (TPR) repeat protein